MAAHLKISGYILFVIALVLLDVTGEFDLYSLVHGSVCRPIVKLRFCRCSRKYRDHVSNPRVLIFIAPSVTRYSINTVYRFRECIVIILSAPILYVLQ